MSLSPDEARELAQPIGMTQGLSVDVQGAQNLGVGSENFDGNMRPSRGLNTRLFGTPARGNDERFERLETAVQSLRDDFDKINPAINRLVAIEGEIQMLVEQLQRLVQGDAPAQSASVPPVASSPLQNDTFMNEEFPEDLGITASSAPVPLAPLPDQEMSAAPATVTATPRQALSTSPSNAPAPTPTPVPTSAPAASPAPATATSEPVLANIRIADHANNTRVVFETRGNIRYTADIDPEKILIVTFDSGASQANLAGLSARSQLIRSVDLTPQTSGGFIIAMPLTKMTKVARQGVLPPDASNPNYRIYIDIER